VKWSVTAPTAPAGNCTVCKGGTWRKRSAKVASPTAKRRGRQGPAMRTLSAASACTDTMGWSDPAVHEAGWIARRASNGARERSPRRIRPRRVKRTAASQSCPQNCPSREGIAVLFPAPRLRRVGMRDARHKLAGAHACTAHGRATRAALARTQRRERFPPTAHQPRGPLIFRSGAAAGGSWPQPVACPPFAIFPAWLRSLDSRLEAAHDLVERALSGSTGHVHPRAQDLSRPITWTVEPRRNLLP
jgi:hypothetical protein